MELQDQAHILQTRNLNYWIKKGKETFYRIFDWSDFAVPKKFNPHTQRKTSIRLKDGLKLQTFTKF